MIVVACRAPLSPLLKVSEGIVSDTQIAMTENLPANNTGDRSKKFLRDILYQAYVLLVTHNFGQKYILYTFQNC